MIEVNRLSETKLGLDGVAANADADDRTCEVNVEHASSITFVYVLTRIAATAMTAIFYLSVDGGTTWGRVPSVAVSAGTGTASDYTWSKAVSGDDDAAISIDCRDATHIKAIFGATGGGATDLMTVQAGAGEL